MYRKLMVLTLFLTGLSVALLTLRHQRMIMIHDTAEIQARTVEIRREIWAAQSRVAELTSPTNLNEQIESNNVIEQVIGDGEAEVEEASND